MVRHLMIAVTALFLVSTSVSADEHFRKKAHMSKKAKDRDKKPDTGASCKAPAVGSCASCAITCRPHETATCGPGQVAGETCTKQPACMCK